MRKISIAAALCAALAITACTQPPRGEIASGASSTDELAQADSTQPAQSAFSNEVDQAVTEHMTGDQAEAYMVATGGEYVDAF